MSRYCNWLQPALQDLLQCVVRFFHRRSSCTMHYIGGRFRRAKITRKVKWRGRKPAITLSCSVLPLEIIMHDDAYIGRCSENNIKCVVHDDLGWKNKTTRYILLSHWFYEWFSQFHSCGTYLGFFSRSPSFTALIYIILISADLIKITTYKYICRIMQQL